MGESVVVDRNVQAVSALSCLNAAQRSKWRWRWRGGVFNGVGNGVGNGTQERFFGPEGAGRLLASGFRAELVSETASNAAGNRVTCHELVVVAHGGSSE